MNIRMDVNTDQTLMWAEAHLVMKLQCGQQVFTGFLLFSKYFLEHQ